MNRQWHFIYSPAIHLCIYTCHSIFGEVRTTWVRTQLSHFSSPYLVILRRVSLSSWGWPQIHYVIKPGLDFFSFLPQFPKCWDCRHAPLFPSLEQLWLCASLSLEVTAHVLITASYKSVRVLIQRLYLSLSMANPPLLPDYSRKGERFITVVKYISKFHIAL